MPNHCENFLYIGGARQEILDFLDFAKSENGALDFNKFIPYPDNFKQMDTEHALFGPFSDSKLSQEDQEALTQAYQKKWKTAHDGYNSGGFEWCRDNWGTKWNAYSLHVHWNTLPSCRGFDGGGNIDEKTTFDYGCMAIVFETAWSPPRPVIHKMIEMFPRLSISCESFECGGAFSCGITAYSIEDIEEGEDRIREWEGEYRGVMGG